MPETAAAKAQFPFTAEGNCAFVRYLMEQKYPNYAMVLGEIGALHHKRPYVSGEPVLTLGGAIDLAAFAAERIWN